MRFASAGAKWLRRQIMIRIWKFRDAPQSLRDLYPGGTDSTWVLEVPASLSSEVEVLFAQNQVGQVQRHDLPTGTIVFFGELAPKTKGQASGTK